MISDPVIMPSPTVPPTVTFTQYETLPLYLSLVSIVTLKCKTISSEEADLKTACDALTASVAKYRKVLEPINSILPGAADLSSLDVPNLDFARLSLIDPDVYKAHLQTLQRENRLYTSDLPGDQIHESLFSKEGQEGLAKMITGKSTAAWEDLIKLSLAILGQVRMARQESMKGDKQAKWLLIVSLLPQILVLTCIILQYMLLKKRELAAKRRNQQIARDRQLLDQLMERRREPPIEMV